MRHCVYGTITEVKTLKGSTRRIGLKNSTIKCVVGTIYRSSDYWIHNWEVTGSSLTWSTASNLEQIANLQQLSLLPSAGRKSLVTRLLWATQRRPSVVADWGSDVSASCTNCPLGRAMDNHIMRCDTIGSCQSAASSEIVKRCQPAGHESDWRKRRYNKCPDLYLY